MKKSLISMELSEAFLAIRKKRPLIHHMTNLVVTNLTANFTLAIGALPIMAYAKEEVEEIVDKADVLLLNIGTITREQLESMLVAAKHAKAPGKKVKIILDPVGCGASALRKEAVNKIISVGIDVIKGNFAEICTIAGKSAEMRGVESEEGKVDVAIEVAETLAKELSCTIAITGREDIVSNGVGTAKIAGGSEMLKHITGSGCMAAASIACFLAVEEPFYASLHGLELMKRCSESLDYDGPASFQQAFFDSVFSFPEVKP
jgi:hydroxyethylthiazole kinase